MFKKLEIIHTDFKPSDPEKESVISVLILDASISMKRFGKTPLETVNRYVHSLRTARDGRVYYFCHVSFSDTCVITTPLTFVDAVVPLTAYTPGDGTLLWETVDGVLADVLKYYKAIDTSKRLKMKIFINVITDGEDNLSSRISFPHLLWQKTAEARELGFELFVYGLGINAKSIADAMGFPSDGIHAITLEATESDMLKTSMHMTEKTTGFYDRPEEK